MKDSHHIRQDTYMTRASCCSEYTVVHTMSSHYTRVGNNIPLYTCTAPGPDVAHPQSPAASVSARPFSSEGPLLPVRD